MPLHVLPKRRCRFRDLLYGVAKRAGMAPDSEGIPDAVAAEITEGLNTCYKIAWEYYDWAETLGLKKLTFQLTTDNRILLDPAILVPEEIIPGSPSTAVIATIGGPSNPSVNVAGVGSISASGANQTEAKTNLLAALNASGAFTALYTAVSSAGPTITISTIENGPPVSPYAQVVIGTTDLVTQSQTSGEEDETVPQVDATTVPSDYGNIHGLYEVCAADPNPAQPSHRGARIGFHLTADGIIPTTNGRESLLIHYKREAPQFSHVPWSSTVEYFPGAIVYSPVDGCCYHLIDSNSTTGGSLDDVTKWDPVLPLKFLAEAVKAGAHGAYERAEEQHATAALLEGAMAEFLDHEIDQLELHGNGTVQSRRSGRRR